MIKIIEEKEIDTSLVVAGRWQPRSVFVDAEINELAESLKIHGLINRIIVFVNESGKYELIAGERRLRAAKMIEWATIPARIIKGNNEELHELSVIDNIQRANLSTPEEIRAIGRLIADGLSVSKLAQRLGKSRAYVQQRNDIYRAAPQVLDLIEKHNWPLTAIRGLLAGAGENHAIQLHVLQSMRPEYPPTESGAKNLAEQQYKNFVGQVLAKRGWVVERFNTMAYSANNPPRPLSLTDKIDDFPTDPDPIPPRSIITTFLYYAEINFDVVGPWLRIGDQWMNDPHQIAQELENARAIWAAVCDEYRREGWEIITAATFLAIKNGRGIRCTQTISEMRAKLELARAAFDQLPPADHVVPAALVNRPALAGQPAAQPAAPAYVASKDKPMIDKMAAWLDEDDEDDQPAAPRADWVALAAQHESIIRAALLELCDSIAPSPMRWDLYSTAQLIEYARDELGDLEDDEELAA